MEETKGTYSPSNKNKNIRDIFGKLGNIYGDALGEDKRAFSYRKAIVVLEKLHDQITNVDDLKGLPSIWPSLQEKIGEILSTRTLARLENFKKDEKVRVLNQFAVVWRIGPTIAEKLYGKGHRTLNYLMSDEFLTTTQKLGLRFHEDINKKIPRHEVKEMKTLVHEVAESIEKNVIVVCGGGQGKDLVGDMDMVITHPNGKSHVGFLCKLLQKLKEIDFLREDLQLRLDHGTLESKRAVGTYFGLCKYPGSEQRHRIDCKVYPYKKYPFGLITWTGNDVLNQRLRILVASQGCKLHDEGCFLVMKYVDGNEVANQCCSVPCKSEREVYNFLAFPWLEPHERNL